MEGWRIRCWRSRGVKDRGEGQCMYKRACALTTKMWPFILSRGLGRNFFKQPLEIAWGARQCAP